MHSVIIRNIPSAVHRAIKSRSIQNGRSVEAEIRNILFLASSEEDKLMLGDLLHEMGRRVNLSYVDLRHLEGDQWLDWVR